MARLSGKAAMVTGAAQGIGATYAHALAAEGALVAVNDIADPTATINAIKDGGGRALGAIADVTKPESIGKAVDDAVAAFGRLDILITNAALFGNLPLKQFLQIESEEWDRLMAVNVRGVFETIKAVVPHMQRQKYGKIVNIASGTVFKGSPMLLHYVASKGAVVAMTRAIARELGDDGIRVNCLAPGLIMSDSVRANKDWVGPVVSNNIASRALKREAVPEDLIGAMLFLTSPDSDFITGTNCRRRRRLGYALVRGFSPPRRRDKRGHMVWTVIFDSAAKLRSDWTLSPTPVGLLLWDPGDLAHFVPASELSLHVTPQRLGRGAPHHRPSVGETVSDCLIGNDLVDRGVELDDDRLRRAARSDEAVPRGDIVTGKQA
jgi:NAD(P)-dependent dehydrogenase (short-subunit alcohol dehydrogenase family)